METSANRNCILSKMLELHFYLEKNCHGKSVIVKLEATPLFSVAVRPRPDQLSLRRRAGCDAEAATLLIRVTVRLG